MENVALQVENKQVGSKNKRNNGEVPVIEVIHPPPVSAFQTPL